jgi:formin-binding protein 1
MTTWSTQLSALEQTAAEHEKLSSQLIASIADPLKHSQARYEELRKLHVDYAGKLEKERDASYGELKKVKGKYDSVCQDVENKRKKTESSFDMSKAKAQGAYHQQLSDMHDMKVRHDASVRHSRAQTDDCLTRIPISSPFMSRINRRKNTITSTSPNCWM